MDESLVEHIDSHDCNLHAVHKSFSDAYRWLNKTRGYTSRSASRGKRWWKRLAHKRARQYRRAVLSGRRARWRPVTGWDVI